MREYSHVTYGQTYDTDVATHLLDPELFPSVASVANNKDQVTRPQSDCHQWVDQKGQSETGNHRFSHEDHGIVLYFFPTETNQLMPGCRQVHRNLHQALRARHLSGVG